MTSGSPPNAVVESGDPDLCIATIERDQLVLLQEEAEAAAWSARWVSVSALVRQVGPGTVYLRPLIRERRDEAGAVVTYRCLVLFRDAVDERTPIISTLDVGGDTLRSLPTIKAQTNAGRAVVDMFSMLFRLTDVTPHGGEGEAST
jgi:hypothetical protein